MHDGWIFIKYSLVMERKENDDDSHDTHDKRAFLAFLTGLPHEVAHVSVSHHVLVNQIKLNSFLSGLELRAPDFSLSFLLFSLFHVKLPLPHELYNCYK